MACEFTVGQNKKMTESEMKAYLLDGGLQSFVKGGNIKVADVLNYFKEQDKESIPAGRTEGETRTKGIVGRLALSDNLPEPLRKRLEDAGISYKAQNQAEADLIAKEILVQYGEAEALDEAKKMTFGGDVSSAIFANVINNTFAKQKQFEADGDYRGAIQQAKRWAEVSIEYDNVAREQGRFISYIKRAYEQNGVGLRFKIIKQKQKQMEDVVIDPQQKTFTDFVKDLEQFAEFKAYRNELVEEALGKKKPATQKTVKKKIFDFLDSLKAKENNTIEVDGKQIIVKKNSIIPAEIFNKGIDLIKSFIDKGFTVAEAVSKGLADMQKLAGTALDLSDFEQQVRADLLELVNEVEASEWAKLAEKLQPKEPKDGFKIKTDIGKINAYLSRRNNAERGVIMAAMVTKLNEMGVITNESLSQGYPEQEALEQILAGLDDAQKQELSTFLADRISLQKNEKAQAASLQKMRETFTAQIAELDRQIAEGKKDAKPERIEKVLPADLEAMKAERDTKRKLLDDIDAGIAGLNKEQVDEKKALERRKKQLQKEIDSINEEITTGQRKVKAEPKQYTDAEVKQLENERDALKEIRDKVLPKEQNQRTFESKVKQAIKTLEKHIEEYQGMIDAREFKQIKKSEPVNTPEIEALRERLKKLKKEYAEMQESIIATLAPDQRPDWYKQDLLNKYSKRMNRMTDEQKQDLIRRSLVEVVTNGGLNEPEFRKILAQVLGYAELSGKEMIELQNFSEQINAAEAAKNKMFEANAAYVANKTPETSEAFLQAQEAFVEAEKKAQKAAYDLNEKMYRKSNAVYTFMGTMQLNTLSLIGSGLLNVAYNVMDLFPRVLFGDVARQGVELLSTQGSKIESAVNKVVKVLSFGTYEISGNPNFSPTFDIRYGADYWMKGFKQGSKEGWTTIKTGQQKVDYYETSVYQTRIRPKESAELMAQYVSDKMRIIFGGDPKYQEVTNLMTSEDVADKTIQATAGWHAEAMGRFLSLTDKPVRFASEFSRAAMIGRTQFKIKDKLELDLFVKFPLEESRRRYFDQLILEGKTPDEAQTIANEKAKANQALIDLAGDRAVLTQQNYAADAIEKVMKTFRGSESASSLAKIGQVLAKATFLFVRVPSNAAWSIINYLNPTIALLQSGHFLRQSYNKKSTETERVIAIENAKKWMSHAIVGFTIIAPLANFLLPAVTGGDDEDDAPKEQAAMKANRPPRSINLSMVGRMLNPFDGNKKTDLLHRSIDEDTYLDWKWFGSIGAVLAVKRLLADREKKAVKKGELKQGEHFSMIQELPTHLLYGLQSGGFENYIALTSAFKSNRDLENQGNMAMMQTYNTLLNTLMPATYAQISRTLMDYNYSVAEDDFLGTIRNNNLSRNIIARWASGNQPPAQITIWGDEAIRSKDSVADELFYMLGVNKSVKNNFAPQLFRMYEATKDADLLPPYVRREFTFRGKKIELDRDKWRELQIEVGQKRKEKVNAFYAGQLDGMTKEEVDGMDYNKALKRLKNIYKKAGESGKKEFIRNNKSYVLQLAKESGASQQEILNALASMVNEAFVETQQDEQ